MTTWTPRNVFDARYPRQLETRDGAVEIGTGTGGWYIRRVNREYLYEKMDVLETCRWLNDNNAALIPMR